MRIRSTIGTVAAVAALGIAGAVTTTLVPHLSTDSVDNTADGTAIPAAPPEALQTADAISVAANLTEALQRDLGITPEQFLEQAQTAATLGEKAGDWKRTFDDVFGGVWLNQGGDGVVGVATVFPDAKDGAAKGDAPADAAKLRDAAKAAGFQVKDVALSVSDLGERQDQVQAVIDGLPEAQRQIVKSVQADPNKGQVVVTTDGGTEAEIGNLTSALRGLAQINTLNAPSPANDTSPLGSLGDGGANKSAEGSDPSTGAVQGLGEGATQEGAEQPGTTGDQAGDKADEGAGEQTPAAPNGASSLAGLVPPEAMTIINQLLGQNANGEDPNANPFGSLQAFVPQPDPEPTPDTNDPSTPAEGRGTEGAPEATAQTQAAPAGDPVVGGTAYESKIALGQLECSTGFNGTLDGKPVVITAAHCNRNDNVRAAFPNNQEFGTFTETQREGIDSALIKVDDSQASRFANNLVGGENGSTQGITGTAAPVVGQVACKMGSRTGYSCGKITQADTKIDVAGQRTIDNAFTIDLCALPGDSGGVVFSGDRALGISSASNVAGERNCDSATNHADAAGVKPSLSVVPIDKVLAAHPGLELNTK
ncbi:trypsin-like serine protease [Dietzia sp.]|uniref:trypsin-like serine protease n=1 Tax=Dietzia sp. TaxID=1871616 RepID=UPI002FD8A536